MNFKDFMTVVKSVTKPPDTYFQTKLSNAIMFADAGVHATFFSSQPAAPYVTLNKNQLDPVLQELSVKYMSFLISKDVSYGFNNTIQGANQVLIDNWFLKHSNNVGQNMFVDYMMQPNLLGPFFQNPAQMPATIASNTASNNFLTSLLVECDTIGSTLPAKILLLMLKLLDNDGPNFKKVLQAWVVNDRWSELEGYDTYDWLQTSQPDFKQGGPNFNALFGFAQKSSTIADPPIRHQVIATAWTTDTYIKTVYGSKLMEWLNNPAGPTKYQLRSGGQPKNVTDIKDNQGCLIAGTPVLLADGSWKPVEQLKEGDELLCGDGSISNFTGELLPNHGLTVLYAINDDEPFMSLEHAVMTQRGWCSMTPHISRELTPHLEVSMLTHGDVIWKVKEVKNGKILYEKITVEKINIQQYSQENAKTGFSFPQRNGHHSNHAAGYLCLAAYPEITTQWLSTNIESKMSPAEKLRFSEELNKLTPMLEKALGAGVTNMVKASLKNSSEIASKAGHTKPSGKHKMPEMKAKDMVLPEMKIEAINSGDKLPDDIEHVGIYQGHMFINHNLVTSWQDEHHIYWERTNSEGKQEQGIVKMLPHGLLGYGQVLTDSVQVPFVANGLVGYATKIGPAQTPWFQFDMGFEKDEKGNLHAVGKVEDPADTSGNDDLQKYSRIVFSQVENDQSMLVLHASLSFDSSFCIFGGSPYIDAEFNFNLNYRNFTGKVYKYDANKPGWRGESLEIVGTCLEKEWLNEMQMQVTNKMQNADIQTHNLAVFPKNEFLAKSSAFGPDILSATPMSVEALFTLPAPDLDNVHQLGFGKLKDLMLLAVSKEHSDWVNWFGQTTPSVGSGGDLSQAEADIIKDQKIQSFLVDKFAVGFLTQAFSKSTDQNIKSQFDALGNTEEKLNYFWKGDGEDSFAKSRSYGLATAKINDITYGESVAGFDTYQTNNPADWAKQLYDYCMNPVTLNGLAMQNSLDGRARITHLSTMLHALDPTPRITTKAGKMVSYSTALYEAVVDVRMRDFVNRSIIADKTDLAGFLTEYLKQYFNSLVDPNSKWSTSVRNEASKELQEIMDEFNVDTVNALVDAMGNLIADSVDLLMELKQIPPESRIHEFSKKLNKIRPGLSGGIMTALSIGVYGFGIYQVVQTFLSWKDLKPQEKVEAIANVLDVTASIFSDIVAWRSARVLASAQSSMEELMKAGITISDSIENARLVEVCGTLKITMEAEMADFAAPGLAAGGAAAAGDLATAEELAAGVSKWENIANIAEGVAKGATILALGAACVATGFQIANDFATGQPPVIKAFDIISEVANGVAFLIEAGSGIAMLAGATICSVIPIIGAVAAVVGILVAFILQFIHRKPPPTPAESFVTSTCIPFLKNLVAPPQAWLDAQKKVNDHLNGSKSASFTMAKLY